MGGNFGAKIGQIKAEVGQLEGKKAEIQSSREQIKGAISELQNRKESIQKNLEDYYNKLGQLNDTLNISEIPDEMKSKLRNQKEQLIEQIALLKNAMSTITSQISSMREKSSMMSEALVNVSEGVRGRQSLLQSVAGRASKSINDYRESGRLKG